MHFYNHEIHLLAAVADAPADSSLGASRWSKRLKRSLASTDYTTILPTAEPVDQHLLFPTGGWTFQVHSGPLATTAQPSVTVQLTYSPPCSSSCTSCKTLRLLALWLLWTSPPGTRCLWLTASGTIWTACPSHPGSNNGIAIASSTQRPVPGW